MSIPLFFTCDIFCDKKEDHFDVIVFALKENKTLPKDFSSNTIDLPTFCDAPPSSSLDLKWVWECQTTKLFGSSGHAPSSQH